MIGILRRVIELGRAHILLEVSLLSVQMALLRSGHLQQVYHLHRLRCCLVCPSARFIWSMGPKFFKTPGYVSDRVSDQVSESVIL